VLIDLVIKTLIFGDHLAARKFGDQNTFFPRQKEKPLSSYSFDVHIYTE
jgi:hypothetical protein